MNNTPSTGAGKDLTADIIKICAVITAMPRWVGALLAAEGIMIPEEWRGWWIVASAIFNAAMAVTEGLAFAYVFNAWRNQKDKNADRLLWLAIASGATFVIVLAPFIAAQVRSVTLAAMLSADWALWAWSASVAASTIIIVASVGYAQKRSEPKEAHKVSREPKEVQSVEPIPAHNGSSPELTVSRQDKVLSLLGQGMTQQQIADELTVSLATIKRDIKLLNGAVKPA